MSGNLCFPALPANWQQSTADIQFARPIFARRRRNATQMREALTEAMRSGRRLVPSQCGAISIDARFTGGLKTDRMRRLRGCVPSLDFAAAQPKHRELSVTDDFVAPVPVTTAELDAVETYLEDVVRELLVSACFDGGKAAS